MTDTRDAVVGSYDDLPESEVATVLAVPLLWHQQATTLEGERPAASVSLSPASATVLPPARHRSGGHSAGRGSGRHRARRSVDVLAAAPEPDSLAHTLQIGLVSAALVLGLCAAALFVIARWLP